MSNKEKIILKINENFDFLNYSFYESVFERSLKYKLTNLNITNFQFKFSQQKKDHDQNSLFLQEFQTK